MTEITKSIIKLIHNEELKTGQTFMDKTLSNGCLFYYNQNSTNKFIELGNSEYFNDGGDIGYGVRCNTYEIGCLEIGIHFSYYDQYGKIYNDRQFKLGLTKDFEIIGHYDITSILRYIRNKVGPKNLKFVSYTDSEIILQDTRKELYFNIYLQNKPLHLYTEQENKALLDLLLKLK